LAQHEEHTEFPGIGCDSASFGTLSEKMNTSPSSPSAKAATANLAETARGAVESMRNTAQDVTKQGQEALSQAGAAPTEMADSASRQAFASEITKMTRDNPLGALAGRDNVRGADWSAAPRPFELTVTRLTEADVVDGICRLCG
jgi:hypothetical protein